MLGNLRTETRVANKDIIIQNRRRFATVKAGRGGELSRFLGLFERTSMAEVEEIVDAVTVHPDSDRPLCPR